MPALARAEHDTALLCEADVPADRARIRVPGKSPTWCASAMGLGPALDALRGWHPDVVYAHGDLGPELGTEIVGVAPAVFFAHNYYGTCISGEKTNKWPITNPCNRRFGWQCLVHYYPHRCGGLNPLTMLSEYQRQTERQRLIRGYAMILTASDHMRSEYVRHGFAPNAVRKVALPVEPVTTMPSSNGNGAHPIAGVGDGATPAPPWRLLFAGRMTYLKGGLTFLDALPTVLATLGRPVRATFAGDGPERARWEAAANQLEARNRGLEIEFTGWMNQAQLDALFAASDLLVVPSLWPEPFGLVGLEAGLRSVPAAAFAVGGIPDWLAEGVNGYLAPGKSPTSGALANAIVKCLRDPVTHARLRRGAAEVARRFSVQQHMHELLDVFAQVVAAGREPLRRRDDGGAVFHQMETRSGS